MYYAYAKRHRHQELLARHFTTQQVYLILDNFFPHRHHKVWDWQEAHPRFHFQFIPTYASWLNPIEHGFSALQRQVLARGSFADTTALRNTLGRNRRATPPRWRHSADAIFGRIAHAQRTYEMVH